MEIRDPAQTQLRSPGSSGQAAEHSRLRDAAIKLEASFLAEMLKSGGLSATRGAFGGGAGEDQFTSILIREHAEQLAEAGGIGLSESIFEALRRQTDAR